MLSWCWSQLQKPEPEEHEEDAVVMNADYDQVRSTQCFGAWLELWVIQLGVSHLGSCGMVTETGCNVGRQRRNLQVGSSLLMFGIWDVSQNRFWSTKSSLCSQQKESAKNYIFGSISYFT